MNKQNFLPRIARMDTNLKKQNSEVRIQKTFATNCTNGHEFKKTEFRSQKIFVRQLTLITPIMRI